MSHTAKIEVKHDFTTEDINDIVATALEGGINYWCGYVKKLLDADSTLLGVKPEDRSQIHFKSDTIGYGGTLVLFDVDYEETQEKWHLNVDKLLNGIAMYCTERGVKLDELMNEYDATAADQIVQYALFGKLVYG